MGLKPRAKKKGKIYRQTKQTSERQQMYSR